MLMEKIGFVDFYDGRFAIEDGFLYASMRVGKGLLTICC
jgi:hypothetical protein